MIIEAINAMTFVCTLKISFKGNNTGVHNHFHAG